MRLIPDEIERIAEEEVARLICATYHEYEHRLAARGMLDFDGILLRVRDALLANPSWAQRVRDRFQYLIVDEFQDTSAVQHEVLAAARPATTSRTCRSSATPSRASTAGATR